MSKKYFAISDIHSFAGYMERDLAAAGFQKTNKDHILIVCGDIFDRGPDSIGVYDYIKSIPKARRILIRGNHEQLYFELLEKSYPEKHDFSNGTVKTFCEIAGLGYELDQYSVAFMPGVDLKTLWADIVNRVKVSKITKWLRSKEWRDYYELPNHIFVHSFLPVQIKECSETKWMRYWPTSNVPAEFLELKTDWRNTSTALEWDDARWGCPWRQFQVGLFDSEKEKGKVLVCGHWHASDFYKGLDTDLLHDIKDGEMYNNHGIVGLDACTVLSHKINVYVIEEKENSQCKV